VAEKRKSNKMVTIVVGIWIVVCVGAVVVAALLMFGPSFLQRGGVAGLETDVPAPDIELVDLSGNTVRLQDLRGQAVVVNYWATWCGPCVREMPMFQKYQEQYPDTLVMIGVDQEEPADEVKTFLQDFDLSYMILLDEKAEASKAYQVMVLPTTFFIDQDGILRFRHVGYLEEEQFRAYLGKLGVFE
jgi:peroxiredoxin